MYWDLDTHSVFVLNGKTYKIGTSDMIQGLRALATLPEGLGLIFSITVCSSNSSGSDIFF